MKAYMTDVDTLRRALTLAEADEQDGMFSVRGGVCLFLGVGPDVLVSEDAEYEADGTWQSLYELCERLQTPLQVTVI